MSSFSAISPLAPLLNPPSSAPSSTPSTPEPLLDDDGDFYQLQKNESQSSFGATPSREENVRSPPSSERPKQPIHWLPSELLIHIFTKLSLAQDLRNCLMVSKFWARCCVDLLWHRPLFTSWNKLLTVANSIQKPDAYWPYSDLIRRLNLSNLSTHINDGSLTPFNRCKRIERLTLTSCVGLTDQGIIGLIEGNRGLLALDITGINLITDDTIFALAQNCPRLQGLNITGCKKVTDESLVPLAENCRHLKRLKLNKCVLIEDRSIEAFANMCPAMLEVDLQDCKKVTDLSVSALLQGGRQLRELRLAQCNEVTDAAFLSLRPELKFETLRILDLTACQQLTDSAVERIIHSAPRLRILVLAKCTELTDRSVLAICKLGKNLHDIHLGRCTNITDDALKELIKCCNRIRYIDLAGCNRVSDVSIKTLATLPKLRRIGLVKCGAVTDRSILSLAKPAIETRSSSGRTRVVSALERVHLSYCVNITIEGIHSLLNNCPKITHLSLTGIEAFFRRDDLITYCREAPPEFSDEQRQVFCVFSGDGVNKLRNYLNEEAANLDQEAAMAMWEEDEREDSGVVGMMQNTVLDGEDFDDQEE